MRAASSASFASISSLVMSTDFRSLPMSFSSTRATSYDACNALRRRRVRCRPPRARRLLGAPQGVIRTATPEEQPATPPVGLDPAGQVQGPLAPPAGDEPVDLLDVPGEQGAGRAARGNGGPADDPAAHGGGQFAQAPGVQGAVGVADLGLGAD